MEEKRIKSITEAYSMQPNTLIVSGSPTGGVYRGVGPHIHSIEFEIDPNHKDVYVGYDRDRNILFRYLVESVNVHYFTNT